MDNNRAYQRLDVYKGNNKIVRCRSSAQMTKDTHLQKDLLIIFLFQMLGLGITYGVHKKETDLLA